MAGKGVGSNSVLTLEGLLQHGGESSWPSAGSAAKEKGEPAACWDYESGELVAFGFPQKGRRRPELMCIAGLQLGDELVDLGCLPIPV